MKSNLLIKYGSMVAVFFLLVMIAGQKTAISAESSIDQNQIIRTGGGGSGTGENEDCSVCICGPTKANATSGAGAFQYYYRCYHGYDYTYVWEAEGAAVHPSGGNVCAVQFFRGGTHIVKCTVYDRNGNIISYDQFNVEVIND